MSPATIAQIATETLQGHTITPAANGDLLIDGRLFRTDNLTRELARHPEDEHPTRCREFLQRLAGCIKTPPAVDLAHIRPRLHGPSLPTHLDVPGCAVREYVGGCWVTMVHDEPRSTTCYTSEALRNACMTIDLAEEHAIANLEAVPWEPEISEAADCPGRFCVVATLDGYDSARLLLPSLHGRLAPHLGRTFVAFAPCRDVLVACSPVEPMLSRARKKAREQFEHMPHPITAAGFLVTRDGVAAEVAK